MIRLTSINRAIPKPRKRADTRALQLARKSIHEQLLAEVQADCIAEIEERHEAHTSASQHFRQHGERMN